MAETYLGWLDAINRNAEADALPIREYVAAIRRRREQDTQRSQALADADRIRTYNLQDYARNREDTLTDQATARQQRVEDITRSENFQDIRDANQAAHAERMNEMNVAGRVKEEEARYAAMAKEKQVERRNAIMDEALTLNLDLPKDVDYVTAYKAVSKARGRVLIDSADVMRKAIDAYAQARGETMQEVMRSSMTQALAGVDQKKLSKSGLTLKDLNALVTNPDSLVELTAKAARDGNQKAYEILTQINADAASRVEEGMKAAEASKPMLQGLAKQFDQARGNFELYAKKGGVSEADSIEANHRLIKSVAAGPAGPPVGPVRRPPPSAVLGAPVAPVPGAIPTAAVPPDGSGYPGVIPAAAGVVGQAAGDVYRGGKILAAPVMAGLRDVNSALWGGPFENPITALSDQWNRTFYPQTSPATMAPNPRLKAFLDAQAATQNALTPTVYPADQPAPAYTPPNFMPAALPYGYQPP